VAYFRAIEAQKPMSERICYDPYARTLIPGVILYSLFKLMINSGIYERIAPGATAFIMGRELLIFLQRKALTSSWILSPTIPEMIVR